MAGHTAPTVFARLGDRRVRPDLLRARRHLPEPRGQPNRAGPTSRPAEAVLARRRRRRAGLRRRRRPLLPGRRARQGGGALDPDRADRARELARPGATIIHNLITSRAVPSSSPSSAAGRSAPGSATRSSRPRWPRRARSSAASTRPLLLPRLLGGRLRHARRAARARRARRDRPPLASCSRRTPAIWSPARSTRPSRPAGRIVAVEKRRRADGVTPTASTGSPSPRRLVVQRPPVEHRAAAAAQRRGPRRGDHGGAARRGAR